MSKNMLIIEDDVVGRALLRLVFEYEGFHCVEAENGMIGLAKLETQNFDIIILDNTMPVMTGLEVLQHLKRQTHQANLPIIMVTGLLNSHIREQVTKLGAYAIVGKPFDLGELRALVCQLTEEMPSPTQDTSLLPK